MLQVTWEWLGMAPALDLANTVAVADGADHDLIGASHDFETWADAEAGFLPKGWRPLLERHRGDLLNLRVTIRELLAAVTGGERPSPATLATLNGVSGKAPEWLEIDALSLELRSETSASARAALLARYARSAMELIALERSNLRRCPAPSCGMFYVSSRASQRWCSIQCGTRARVARHYRARRAS